MSKKALFVKNLKPFKAPDQSYFDSKWSQIETEITAMLNCDKYTNSLEELYKLTSDLYSQKYHSLLSKLQTVFENHLTENLDRFLKTEQILRDLDNFWKKFCENVKTLKNVMIYYDRSAKLLKYNSVNNICFTLFADLVLRNTTIRKKIAAEILSGIQSERLGRTIDKLLFKSIVEMLSELRVYEETLELDYFETTREFYTEESETLLKVLTVPQFLTHINQRIFEEQHRVSSYLNKNSADCLLKILHKTFIEDHVTAILDKGCYNLLEHNLHQELILLFKLFQKVTNGTKCLLIHFKDFIRKKGAIITEAKNDKHIIEQVLELKNDLETVIAACFDNRKEFYECIRFVFKAIVNDGRMKSAQLLAKYIDLKMRCKDLSDEELEVVLSRVIKLFKYIDGKDLFEAFYRKLLAKRLLLGKSANQDAENSMISKLKEECGGGFTSNIEGMFQDMNVSRTINDLFKQKRRQEVKYQTDFSVTVLTNSYWPSYPNYKLHMPCDLHSYQEEFQRFYLGTHSGRKLLWQPNLSHCLLKARFTSGFKELQVSLFQATVLLLFNLHAELTFKELQEATSLSPLELKATLVSLVSGRAKILRKTPPKREFSENDAFGFNDGFVGKLYRLKINQIQLQDSEVEEKEIEANVLVDRQFQIDAAIVRVMKRKKSVKHAVLVQELFNVLDFPVGQSDLKKRIELLIEREYMERDATNKSNYIYIA